MASETERKDNEKKAVMTGADTHHGIPQIRHSSISAIYIHLVAKILASKELNLIEICDEAGFDIALLENPNQRFSCETINPLLNKAVEKSADPDFGLHLGEHILEFAGHILFTIMHHSPNLQTALDNFCRYYNLLSDFVTPVVDLQGSQVILTSNNLTRGITHYRHALEAFICRYYCTFNWLIEGRLELDEVHFVHPAPSDITTHKRIFKCPLLFGQNENGIIFNKKYLDYPISASNLEFLELLEDHAKTIQNKIYHSTSFTSHVKNAIIELLPLGRTDIDTVAKKLAMSKRNLQYKLKNEGISYQELLDKMRNHQAKYFLRQIEISIVEVAFLVGYSEQSTFNRAFKKWTGMTPGEYRHKIISSKNS